MSAIALKRLRWQKTKYFPLRFLEISAVAAQLVLYLSWDNLFTSNSSRQQHHRAQWLVRKLVHLGPTFIKIGQALSTRPDLLPLEYIQELSQLQDKVPPFSSDEVIAVIESELGNSLYALYRDFNPYPLASASLGQVHKARLHTGEDVVVKVQRPGLKKLFDLDFLALQKLIAFANLLIPGVKKYDLKLIYQEFFQLLYQEIDYLQEGKNADRFRVNFEKNQQVIIPLIYWSYTTKKILTMEYCPGIKIDDRQRLEASNIDTDKIIKLGICSYLKQLLQDGFFQSDPHPGNMAVSQRGEIIFYDFGTMAEIKSMAKEQMIKTFFAILRKDTNEVVETLTYMGLIEPMEDMTPVRRLVAFILEKFRDKPVDIKAFEEISSELYLMFEQQPFRLPPQMTFIIKSLTTLDGIARALDPDYNLLAAAQPFIKSLTFSANDDGNLIKTIAKQTQNFVKYQWEKPTKIELLINSLEARIETGELQFRVRSLETERTLKLIYLAVKTLVYTGLTGISFLGAILLLLGHYQDWAIAFFVLGLFWFLLLIISLLKLSFREKLSKLTQK